MRYQDCVEAAQATDEESGAPADHAAHLAAANINPVTGFATDYLNHFNEAIMLLEMMADCPDCRDDFLSWQPMSYREHFVASRLKASDLAIAAYDAADPKLRNCLDTLAGSMTAVLQATSAALRTDMPPDTAGALADRAATWLKPLIARAGAVINGETDAILPYAPQAVVDGLMKR